jgi:hypothetical protein
MRRVARVGIVMVILLAAGIAARSAILRSLRESATILLPGDAGTVTFIRQRQDVISLVDVAYDRKIVYRRPGHPARSWTVPVDAGYNMSVNVYWISDGEKSFVRFDDPGDEYVLDLQSNTLYLLFPVTGVLYAGRMDDGNTGHGWYGGIVDGNTAGLFVTVGKNRAVPLATLVSDPKGAYMGEIMGNRFTLAKDAPETPAKKLFPSSPDGL